MSSEELRKEIIKTLLAVKPDAFQRKSAAAQSIGALSEVTGRLTYVILRDNGEEIFQECLSEINSKIERVARGSESVPTATVNVRRKEGRILKSTGICADPTIESIQPQARCTGNASHSGFGICPTAAEVTALLASKQDILATHDQWRAKYQALAESLSPEKAQGVFHILDQLRRADELLLLAGTHEDIVVYLIAIKRFEEISGKSRLVLKDRKPNERAH